MGIGNRLVGLGIPVGVCVLGDVVVFAFADELFPHGEGEFVAIAENINGPVVGTALISVDYVDRDFEFRFVVAILADLDYLCVRNVSVLD